MTDDDVFQPTLNTWIHGQLAEGVDGRKAVNHHVMSAYSMPLKVYFLGHSARGNHDAEDVIQGFFADRLARGDFFDDWKASGKRLRYWLVNAFNFYLWEVRRPKKIERMSKPLPEDMPLECSGDTPEQVMDRAFTATVVQNALEEAERDCAEKKLQDHYRIFVRHHMEDESFKAIAADFGVTPGRAQVMARTARDKFKAAVRQQLLRDGVPVGEVDDEIRALGEVIN